MTDQQPRATRDGITWDVGGRPPTAPAAKPAGPPSPPTVPPKTSAAGAEPTKKRRRWAWIIIAAVLAALIAWSVYDHLTAPDGSTPSSTSRGTSTANTAGANVALKYLTASLANHPDTACPLAADEASCRRVAAVSTAFETSEAPHVVQAEHVSRGGLAGDADTATGVLIQFTIKDQANPQREVVFVRDGDLKVLDTESVGHDDAGKSLQQLFEEAGR